MKFPVFDLHCDTAVSLLNKDLTGYGSLYKNKGHVDLFRAQKLNGYAQCFAIFTAPSFLEWYGVPAEDVFQNVFRSFSREIMRHKALISQAGSGQEIEANRKRGVMSAVFTLEGPAGIRYDPQYLEVLYQHGLRISTLGWNESNPLTGSHLTGEGLTDQGRAYVRECQRLGILVDVSHISDRGFWDIMEITEAPVIASHSNSRSVCNVSRNLTDDMYREICNSGGTVGINFYTPFLKGKSADFWDVLAHIRHFLQLDPTGKHLSLGGDLDGCETLPCGFTGVESYPVLSEWLLSHGVDHKTLTNLYWNNGIGVIDYALHVNEKP